MNNEIVLEKIAKEKYTIEEDDDEIEIYLNGETAANKAITLDGGRNLPFTISGILMTSVVIKMADADTTASDTIDILTFH